MLRVTHPLAGHSVCPRLCCWMDNVRRRLWPQEFPVSLHDLISKTPLYLNNFAIHLVTKTVA